MDFFVFFCYFFLTFVLNTIISTTIYKEFMYSENGCEQCMSVRTMDVENENEWISVTVCASIDSAL